MSRQTKKGCSMAKFKPATDPRGHSLRVYSDVYDSPAFAALTPHDVMAYLALLRVLKGYNNGDLSLPLSRAKHCGISHPKTLARSLRALSAVGLIALTRKGGCTKGGQRLPNLYRVTDRECNAIPAKHLEAMPATNEWQKVGSMQHGKELIAAAELAAKRNTEKLKCLGHPVPLTMAPSEPVKPKTMAPREPWNARLGHPVNMAEIETSPEAMRVATTLFGVTGKQSHRAPDSTPIYLYQSTGLKDCLNELDNYQRLIGKPARLFTNLLQCAAA
jgi:hypothetical protein